jgi:hypothetical protein
VTEPDWLASDDPKRLLLFAERSLSPRRGRLLAAGFCRRIRGLWKFWPGESAIEVVERFADGLASAEDLDIAQRAADAAGVQLSQPLIGYDAAQELAAVAVSAAAASRVHPPTVLGWAADAVRQAGTAGLVLPAFAALVRDVAGNPFRPAAFPPDWLTSTAVALADGIYDERAFDRLPVLADALEDAGCDDPDILAHCRRPGPHVRGCWVVDRVLGRG